MGKVKIKNISNSKMNAICKKYSCSECPLQRIEKCRGGQYRHLMCYRRCRALYYANKIYYEQLFKMPLQDYDRAYHEAQWEKEQEEQMKLEEREIELND